MEYRIIPTVLASGEQEFCNLLDKAESFADHVQIDFMDGSLAPSQSVPLDVIARHRPDVSWEIDLLVDEPVKYFERVKELGGKRVIFYIEAPVKPEVAILKARELGLEVALANQVETPIERFEKYIVEVDEVQFFTGKLGFYGGELNEEVLPKIKAIREKYPEKDLGIDGGVSLENIAKLKEAGINRFAIGGHLMKTEKPAKTYEEFLERIR